MFYTGRAVFILAYQFHRRTHTEINARIELPIARNEFYLTKKLLPVLYFSCAQEQEQEQQEPT